MLPDLKRKEIDVNMNNLTKPEVQQILMILRHRRDVLVMTEVTLSERLRSTGDGERRHIQRELEMVKADIDALTNLVAKLWTILYNLGD